MSLYISRDTCLGEKVIVQGNDTPASFGIFKGWRTFRCDGNEFPVVETDGTEFITFGVVLPFNPDIYKILRSMQPYDAWEWCANFSLITQFINCK